VKPDDVLTLFIENANGSLAFLFSGHAVSTVVLHDEMRVAIFIDIEGPFFRHKITPS
jgi:hypothetical protein